MTPLQPADPRKIAAAVSGGADSLALADLLEVWCRRRGGRLRVYSVDHGLRREAAVELAQVAAFCAARGLPHRVLTWRGEKPVSGLQAAARAARYDLLLEAAASDRIRALCLAHQADDQAETFLMRLRARSGEDGLAAMPSSVYRQGIRLLRPLLRVTAARLRAHLEAKGIGWSEDPSNRDHRFERVRLREMAGGLSASGFGLEACCAAAAAFGRLREVSDRAAGRLMMDAVAFDPLGYARVDQARLLDAGEVIGGKALAYLLQIIGAGDYRPAPDALSRLWSRLPLTRPATLAGCLMTPRNGELILTREVRRTPILPLTPGARQLWDRRYGVRTPLKAARPLTLGPLGADGVRRLRRLGFKGLEALPACVRPTLPTLWLGEEPIFVPGLYETGQKPKGPLPLLRYNPPQTPDALCFTVVPGQESIIS